MKLKVLTIFLLVSVGAMSILGFLNFVSASHDMGIACMMPGMFGVDCPNTHSYLAMTMHHIDGLQAFMQAHVGMTQSLLILFILSFVSFFLFLPLRLENTSTNKNLIFYWSRNIDSITNFMVEILRWAGRQNKVHSHSQVI